MGKFTVTITNKYGEEMRVEGFDSFDEAFAMVEKAAYHRDLAIDERLRKFNVLPKEGTPFYALEHVHDAEEERKRQEQVETPPKATNEGPGTPETAPTQTEAAPTQPESSTEPTPPGPSPKEETPSKTKSGK